MTWPRHKLINYQILENVDILIRKKELTLAQEINGLSFAIFYLIICKSCSTLTEAVIGYQW